MELKALNNLDKTYQGLLQTIIDEGQERDTRAGKVKSLFGKQISFDLQEGFPLLTTKKMFFKGIAHELLWFLQHPYNHHGSMNIKYLIDNGVHIWDGDAYRWFKEWVQANIIHGSKQYYLVKVVSDDEVDKVYDCIVWEHNDEYKNNYTWLLNMSIDEFLKLSQDKIEIHTIHSSKGIYRFGDLGGIYGKQWRSYGDSKVDQIQNIIDTLMTNPSDRRMLCLAYNPSVLNEVALPPCHIMIQFYTRRLSPYERWELYRKKYINDDAVLANTADDMLSVYKEALSPWVTVSKKQELEKKLDESNIPVMGLSCMWTQRSVDCFLGLPFNIASYALLTYMIGHIVGMAPDKLVGSLGDCHIYCNHMEAVNEQLNRQGSYFLPNLNIKRKVEGIDDFKYDDFIIEGYKPDGVLRAKLNVGN